MRYLIFDLETQNTFHDVGSNDSVALDISVGSFYDSETDTYTTVTIDELSNIWPLIEKADALVGYNSNHFDIPLLNKYYPMHLSSFYFRKQMPLIKHYYMFHLHLILK